LDGQSLRHLRSSLTQPQPDATSVDPVSLFVRHDDYALTAGEPLVAGGRLIARGAGTNDWRRYPPGFVDASETAVSWAARALGARRQIEIEVVAHIAAPVTAVPLAAEVRVNEGPPNRVSLSRQVDVWTGRADLDLPAGETQPRIEIGVLLPGFDPGPETGGGADRDSIRALVRRRLATGAQPIASNSHPHNGTSGPFLAEIAAATTDEDY
jgi:hypothetical protein